jgi:hypothetical protein
MRRSLYIILLVSLTASAQTSNDKIRPEITNSKTSKHINIPGTRVYIIPPANFNVAGTFIGLQKGDNAMFNIYDLVGGNFYSNTATFSKAEFEQKGVKVFDYRDIKVNGYPAKYIFMQGDDATRTYGLIFGDTTFSTMILAVCPVADETTSKEIINALNTIWYDKSKKIDPFETANFSLDDKVSKFKFAQYNANIYIYSIDGVQNKEDKDAPVILVSQFPKDNTTTVKNIADMMISKMQQYGLTDPEIKNPSTQKINGYDCYETEVYGQMLGKNSLLYYCVVAKGDKVIVVQGIAKRDIENNLQEFKKLTGTIKVK